MAIRAIMAGGLVALTAAGVAKDVPDLPAEVVVVGELGRIEAGRWHIRQWPSRTVFFNPLSPGSGHAVSLRPGWDARRCIVNGGGNATIGRLLGDGDLGLGCSRLRLAMVRGRLSGSKSCTRMAPSGPFETKTRYRGTLTPTRIDVRIEIRQTQNGEDFLESSTRLEADRTRDCPGTAVPSVPPAAAPAAPLGAPPAALATARNADLLPAPSDKTIPTLDPVTAAPATPVPVSPVPSATMPSVPESADDVVVVARRLRKLRLNYASTGRVMSRCRADISSGDKRVDRIGCAIVRACVRAGFGERGPDIACFRRKVDSLDPD